MSMTRVMRRHIVFASMFFMAASAEAVAQSSTGELEKRLEDMQSQMVAMQKRIADLEAATRIATTSAAPDPRPAQSGTFPTPASQGRTDESGRGGEAALQYKGLSLIPGGFLEGTTLFRTRNENADIANSYSAVPLNGSSDAQLSEFRGTARNSEFSLL